VNKTVTPTDPLAALHDIHMPPPIGWWPPAPGWWILLTLTLILITSLCWWLRRRKQARRSSPVSKQQIVAAANMEVDQLAEDIESGLIPGRAVADLSCLLRRVAIQLAASHGDTNDVAGLIGEAWLRWLDNHWDRDDFSHGVGRELLDAPYSSTSDTDMSALLSLTRAWLEKQS